MPLQKPRPNRRVLDWLDGADQNALHISCLTLGEIIKGARKLPAGARRMRFETFAQLELPTMFAGRILAIDDQVALRWGILRAEIRRTLAEPDALIAATAITHGLCIVTRNVKDFDGLGAPLINPWDA